MNFPAKLLLENGVTLEGSGFGSKKIGVGEVVFNTAMTGYQEILTDPSYNGQIITFTYPHIGNTGVNNEDYESKSVSAKGVIVKNLCLNHSNWRSEASLNDFLLKNDVVCISDLDTRYLTKILREEGCKIGAIYPSELINDDEAKYEIQNFGSISSCDLTAEVATKNRYLYSEGTMKESPIVAVVDFGIKENILRIMSDMGAKLVIFPPNSTYESILEINPDGVFLSNGPGDPTILKQQIDQIQKLMKLKKPMFGICLGHQLMALAFGLNIEKMQFGHHGANHPVHDLENNTVFITSQNHNFCVSETNIDEQYIITHRSLFDQSIQGIMHRDLPFYSIQCHPEASPGPKEFEIMFKKFFRDLNAQKK